MKKADVTKIASIVLSSGVNPNGHSMDMELINGVYQPYIKVWVWFGKRGNEENGGVELVDHRDFKALTSDDEVWLKDWAAKIAKERDENASD